MPRTIFSLIKQDYRYRNILKMLNWILLFPFFFDLYICRYIHTPYRKWIVFQIPINSQNIYMYVYYCSFYVCIHNSIYPLYTSIKDCFSICRRFQKLYIWVLNKKEFIWLYVIGKYSQSTENLKFLKYAKIRYIIKNAKWYMCSTFCNIVCEYILSKTSSSRNRSKVVRTRLGSRNLFKLETWINGNYHFREIHHSFYRRDKNFWLKSPDWPEIL